MRTARARWASGTRSVPVGGRDLVGAALAGVVLVGLVIGLPLLLGTVAPLSAAEVSELAGVLARPADGTLLRLVLTVSAWSGWAVFTLSVVLEAGAVLRRRPTPRIPLLAGPQRSAAALIAAVSLLLVPASAPAGPPPRSVVLAHGAPGPDAAPPVGGPRHGPDLVDRAVPPTGSGAHRPKPARTYPTVVVVRHDTLWRLAERHLGSGLRYREIVELNRGRPQPDGGSLTDPHWIYPGWELRLPNDARGPGLRRAADVPRPVTVDRGPAAASPAPVDRAPAAAVPRPRPAEIDTATGSSATQPRDGSSWLAAAAPTVDSDPVQPLPLLALGLGSVTVAAVLAELARQRRSRQRIRRSGERIAMPTGEVAAAERELRSLPDACAERVRAAMAHLVDGCAAAGRELPQVAVVRVRPEAIELVLAVDEPEPVAPFDHAAERVWSWSGPLVTPPPSADRVDPCPALLSVGIDGGDLVLVNLEAAGTLRVLAPPEQAVPVVAALSIDLTTAARGGRVSLAVGDGSPSASSAGDGVEAIDPVGAAGRVRSRQEEVRASLGAAGVADVQAARSAGVAEEAWVPEVTVGDVDAVAQPWTGAAVVTTQAGPGWTLTPARAEQWRLDPPGIAVEPQHLSPDHAERVEALLDRVPAAHPVTVDEPAGVELARVRAALAAVRLPGPAPQPDPAAPRLLLLGPVVVVGADDTLITGRVRRATELVAYLMLHPGAGRHEVDEALWPGARVGRNTRNPFVSRSRLWLGRDEQGHAYLPLLGEGGEYRLAPTVGCDWHDFVRSALRTLAADRPALGELAEALALVRARPFQGIDPALYAWAEPDLQDMVSAVVDVAHLLAGFLLRAGDGRSAARAAATGLLVEPCSETLHRDAIAAAAQCGDTAGVGRAVERMTAAFAELDLAEDLAPETVELLRAVLH